MVVSLFRGCLTASAVCLLLLVQGVVAAEPVAGYVNGTQEVIHATTLADGNVARRIRISVTVVTDDTDNPLHLASQDCFVTYIFTPQDEPVTGRGFCDGISAAGDLWWISLELLPDGTIKWENLGGVGRFEKLVASGTTSILAEFDDGKAIARFEGNYSFR